jgi:carbamoylphosphate synthase large subunit
MSRVLLVDTNFSAAPIHEHLVAAGNDVLVVGGNPADYLAKSSANHVAMDYSDADRLAKLADDSSIDCIVPGCNDMSYRVCAQVAELRPGRFAGLDSVAAVDTLNDKEKFRAFAAAEGLPAPRRLDPVDVAPGRSVIVKPADAYSGRGVTVLRESTPAELRAALELASGFSRSGRCLVEEFVEGQLYSHTAFIVRGDVLADFVVEEHGTANPFVVDTSRVDFEFPAEMLGRLREATRRMASALSLVDGLVHTQFIRKGDAFWMIEVTRRCPGDLYSLLIELSTGYPYAEAYARAFLGQTLPAASPDARRAWVARHTLSLSEETTLGALCFSRPVRIERLVPIALAGDRIKPSPFGRIGLLFAREDSKEALDDLYACMLRRELYAVRS